MTTKQQNLFQLADMFRDIHCLYLWCYNSNLELTSTNYENVSSLQRLFSFGGCAAYMKEHFQKGKNPVILNDEMGFVWIAAYNEKQSLYTYCVLGPIFTSHSSVNSLVRRSQNLQLSPSLMHNVVESFQNFPVISLNQCIIYSQMLHYALHQVLVKYENVSIQNSGINENITALWRDTKSHNSWEFEREMLHALKEGLPIPNNINVGNIGQLSHGDPLRQAQNEFIVTATLYGRTAISAGVSSEEAYQLSDDYIQLSERSVDIGSISMLTAKMYETFSSRIQLVRMNRTLSSPVISCRSYIESHINEKILLEDLAEYLGYTPYYISRLFKKEVGIPISSYIQERKIEKAKSLLGTPGLSSADVSQMLHFTSPSYFGSVFKKFVGCTPHEYQMQLYNT